MPNHITNHLKIIDVGSHTKEEIINFFLNDSGHVDFNKVTPQPEGMSGFNPNSAIIEKAYNVIGKPLEREQGYFFELEKDNRVRTCFASISHEEIEQVIKCLELYKQSGFVYWYDFNHSNWGTKWNAYEQPKDGYSVDTEIFEFQTAWSSPKPIFIKLSQAFPDAVFEIKYADEDLGHNCGSYQIKNGEIILSELSSREQTKEEHKRWVKFAFELCYPDSNPLEHGLSDDFEYIDD